MIQTIRRLSAIILTIALICSSVQVSVFADDIDPELVTAVTEAEETEGTEYSEYTGEPVEEVTEPEYSLFEDECAHLNTVNVPETPATCVAGYTAGIYCNDCGQYISGHEEIAATKHADYDGDGLCDGCGETFILQADACGDNVTFTLDLNGLLTLSGSGDTYDYTSTDRPSWYSIRQNIKSIVIENGITSIGNYLFGYCINLESIEIPDGVTRIGKAAFTNCRKMTAIDIPDSVSGAFEQTFYGCFKLTNVVIPDGVIELGRLTFYQCTGLKTVTIPDSVTSIGEQAFRECNVLTGIDLPDNLVSIGEYAFYKCTAVNSLMLSDSLTEIKDNAFSYCSSLTRIMIPDSVTSIGAGAFAWCSNLTRADIPESVISIGDNAFYNCSKLTIYGNTDSEAESYATENGISFVSTGIHVHSFINYVSDNNATCTSDGTKTAKCETCNATDTIADPGSALGHIANEAVRVNVVEADCEHDGSYELVTFCSVCREEISRETVITEALGHSFTDYTSDGNATCEVDGTMTARCDRCDVTYTVIDEGSAHHVEDDPVIENEIVPTVTENGSYELVTYCKVCGTELTRENIILEVQSYGTCGNNLTWILDNEGTLIISGTGDMTGFTCTSGQSWSDCNSEVLKVVIKEGVTSINSGAFSQCGNMISVEMGNTVTSIGDTAFYHNVNLTDVTLSESLISIGKYAFYECPITSIDLPNGLESIGEGVFGYTELTSVSLPDSLTSMGASAFTYCQNLESVIFSQSITQIPNSTFAHCVRLNDVFLPSGLQSIQFAAFADCGFSEVTLPESLTTIGDRAFSTCASLEYIGMPDNVTSIGSYAFNGCTSLASVDLNNVTSIGSYAFNGCTLLTSVGFNEGLNTIGEYAFAYCSVMESVILPDSINSIGQYAFKNCTSLNRLYLGHGITDTFNGLSTIGTGAFSGCSALVIAEVPDSVNELGNSAFSGCSSLTSITFKNESVTINSYSVPALSTLTIWGKNGSTAETYAAEKNIQFRVICEQHQLQTVNEVAYTCTTEGNVEYYVCDICGKIYLDASCDEEVQLKDTVTPADHVWNDGIITKENNAAGIAEYTYSCTLCGETRQETIFDNGITDGGFMDNGLSWSVNDENVLQISGEGDMPDLSRTGYPWSDYYYVIEEIIINEGITSISNYAFNNFKKTYDVSLPESLTYIGPYAFGSCIKIEEIVIPENVSVIYAAFWECSSLRTVVLHEGLEEIGKGTFYGCTSLEALSIPTTVNVIGQQAFVNCTSLEELEIPDGVTELGQYTFQGCRSLKTIILPHSLKSIDRAFTNSVIEDIYFIGTEKQWNKIKKNSLSSDTVLENAEKHFVTIGSEYYPDSIEITGSSTMVVGESQQLEPVFINGINIEIEYSVSDNSIIVVGDDGLITAIRPGTATVYMTSEDGYRSASIEITVSEKELDKMEDTLALENSSPVNNNNYNNYTSYGGAVLSYLVEIEDDGFMRVASDRYGNAFAEYIDKTGNVSNRVPITDDLKFTGFFAGADFYFVVFCASNPSESRDVEVVRVVKYDKEWNRISQCSIYGANTVDPVASGSLRMAELNGILYIHTCHIMFRTAIDGLNHQANMTFAIDESTMTVKDSLVEILNNDYGYVSHSFNQFIKIDNGMVYRVDQGDGHPRGIFMSGFDSETGSLKAPTVKSTLVTFPGMYGNNYTGASVGGFEIAGKRCVIVYNQDSVYNNGYRNIKLISVDLESDSYESTIVSLTDYAEIEEIKCYTPQIVKVNDNLLVVMWSEVDSFGNRRTAIARVDARGQLIDEIVRCNYILSDCQPILLSDGTISWYASDGNDVILYNLDPYDFNAFKPEEKSPAITIYGDSLTLGSNIGMNYYLTVDSEQVDISDACAVFTQNGVETRIRLSEADLVNVDGTVMYRMTYPVNAKEMNDTISLMICGNDGEVYDIASERTYYGDSYGYSVKAYLEKIKYSDSAPDTLKALALAMADYGIFTQVYFEYMTDEAGSPSSAIDDVNYNDLAEYEETINGSVSGITYVGSSLILESNTVLRHYFRFGSENEIGEYSFLLSGTEAEATSVSNGLYYVDISNIAAHDLDRMFELEVRDSSGNSFTITYGALSYACNVLSGSYQQELENIVKALYLYNQAADAYFSTN